MHVLNFHGCLLECNSFAWHAHYMLPHLATNHEKMLYMEYRGDQTISWFCWSGMACGYEHIERKTVVLVDEELIIEIHRHCQI